MITRLAVAGYRSLRDLVIEVAPLTLVTGTNGSGKSSLYRALRLLGEVAQGRLVAALAAKGGLPSALWAGPETIGRAVRRGEHPVQGTARRRPISLRLGFTGDDLGYAIDLGMPEPMHPFPLDPEIEVEAMWTGGTLGRTNLFAERRGPMVRLRRADSGTWRTAAGAWTAFDSMVAHVADAAAPARRPGVATFTPVLASDGGDLAAALATIAAIGDARALADAVDDAFPGATPEVMVRNEPEPSLHPASLPSLARLLRAAAARSQVIVVSHSGMLAGALGGDAATIALAKDFGETIVEDAATPAWAWPQR